MVIKVLDAVALIHPDLFVDVKDKEGGKRVETWLEWDDTSNSFPFNTEKDGAAFLKWAAENARLVNREKGSLYAKRESREALGI